MWNSRLSRTPQEPLPRGSETRAYRAATVRERRGPVRSVESQRGEVLPLTDRSLWSRLCVGGGAGASSMAVGGPPRPMTAPSRSRLSKARRGSALLTVLWMSAALAAIGFSLASTVRGEAERTATAVDSLRCYYLATGSIERATVELLWSVSYPQQRRIPQGATFIDYAYASGVVHVELIPEASKLDINRVPPEELYRVALALGAEAGRAQEIAAALDDYRRPSPGGSPFDPYYLSLVPSFRAPHASLQEIEELLLVKGVTPELYYGTWIPAQTGDRRLTPRAGLADCLSVYGSRDRVDVNTAQPAVLAAIGLDAYAVNAILERRRVMAFTQEDLGKFLGAQGIQTSRLRVEGESVITIRATAQLRLPDGRLSDLKRTVASVVKYMPSGSDSAVHTLRWYDTAWRN
jgi:general secretion pathway protein K